MLPRVNEKQSNFFFIKKNNSSPQLIEPIGISKN